MPYQCYSQASQVQLSPKSCIALQSTSRYDFNAQVFSFFLSLFLTEIVSRAIYLFTVQKVFDAV